MFSEPFITAGLKVFGRILIVLGVVCFALGAIISIFLLLNQSMGVNGFGLGMALGAVFYGFIILFLGFIGCGLAFLLEKNKTIRKSMDA